MKAEENEALEKVIEECRKCDSVSQCRHPCETATQILAKYKGVPGETGTADVWRKETIPQKVSGGRSSELHERPRPCDKDECI